MNDTEMLKRLKEGYAPIDISIMKWDKPYIHENDIAEIESLNIAANCALCEIYYSDITGCRKCPVFQITGKEHCDDTPYEMFAMKLENDDYAGAIPFIKREKVFLEHIKILIYGKNDPCWNKYQKWEIPKLTQKWIDEELGDD